MSNVSDTAVCIRQWDWSETSQTVSLLTKTLGIVRAVAKGARRENASFSGGLNVATEGDITLSIKPGRMAIVTSWDLSQPFPGLRQRLGSYNCAMYAIDLISHTLAESDPHPVLYDHLIMTLNRFSAADGCAESLLRPLLSYQWLLLTELGFKPVVDRNAVDGSTLPTTQTLGFSTQAGGVVPDPAESSVDAAVPDAWRVRASTIRVLAQMDEALSASIPDSPGDSDTEMDLIRANRLLASYISHTLGVEPPTMPVLFAPGGSFGPEP